MFCFRYIKMSSPHLNNLIIIGAMLTYTSVIFLGLNSRMTSINMFPYICAARAWLLMAGFSLAFGAMFSKTWRVHSIFTDITINKKVNSEIFDIDKTHVILHQITNSQTFHKCDLFLKIWNFSDPSRSFL